MLRPRALARLCLLLAIPLAASAQSSLIDTGLQHTSSGTSLEPASTPHPMLMEQRSGWTLMLHANAFLADTQQHANDGRGGDKLFSTNWIMPMAAHPLGHGQITLRTMLSLEPATITGRFYPELFQQGETAFGKPIVDGQHPHDFVMELAALYDLRLTPHTLLGVYVAPVGDPAIGPTAYPHRLSASEDPIAALGHHQEDSTHIAFNVVTAGIAYKLLRLEGSGFHGGEPGESRWSLEPSPNGHAIDSYSTRLTLAPTANLTAQYSIARTASPEALSPGQDQGRQTASISYNRPIGIHRDTTSMPGMTMATPATGIWSNTLLWGHTRNLTSGAIEDSYLLESLLTLHRQSLYTRIESAARTTELLNPSGPELPLGHVQAYTLGVVRDYRWHHLRVAPGAQFTLYRSPNSLAPAYGRTPFGAVVFLRLRLSD